METMLVIRVSCGCHILYPRHSCHIQSGHVGDPATVVHTFEPRVPPYELMYSVNGSNLRLLRDTAEHEFETRLQLTSTE
jgi:hypothetical protein